MVEAPGTAPGSETLMSRGVYRHSRFPDITYIGDPTEILKEMLNWSAAFQPAHERAVQ